MQSMGDPGSGSRYSELAALPVLTMAVLLIGSTVPAAGQSTVISSTFDSGTDG